MILRHAPNGDETISTTEGNSVFLNAEEGSGMVAICNYAASLTSDGNTAAKISLFGTV